MPGRICAVVGCSATSVACRGLSFHSIHRPKDQEWEKALVKAINRCDKGFNPKTAKICSRHFEDHCFLPGKKEFERILKKGSCPTLLMPQRSFEVKQKSRKPPAKRHAQEPECEEIGTGSFDFPEEDVSFVSIPNYVEGWHIIKEDDYTDIIQYNRMKIPRCLRVEGNEVTAFVEGKLVIEELPTNIHDALRHLESLEVCTGITQPEMQDFEGAQFYREQLMDNSQQKVTSVIRSVDCTGGCRGGVCKPCTHVHLMLKKRLQRRRKQRSVLSTKAPLRYYSKTKLSKALQVQRRCSRELQRKVKKIRHLMKSDSISMPTKLHSSLEQVLDNETLSNPMTKLFWQEQKKNFARQPNARRWHPMMVRLAILLHCQSPAAYRSLKETGVLALPGETTIRDYTNVVGPMQGFNPEVIEELKDKAAKLPRNERWVTIMFDEMSIKSDLVYSQRSDEIVGFVNSTADQLASHVLVYMVAGIIPGSPIKQSIGYFGTHGVSAASLYPEFWMAVHLLEKTCGLQVIAATADKAAANQRFFDLHGGHSTVNLHAPERKIFFFSDPPHLLKTLRNNLSNSGAGLKTRYLWKNGKHLLWAHIQKLHSMTKELKVTKLTDAHIYLNSYSVMKVKLAAQVMSASVANALELYGGEEASETAKFVRTVDRFFDILNVRSCKEGHRTRKTDLLPFTDPHDDRFEFLENGVLGYLRDWRKTVDNRDGFTKTEKARMFISHQTYKGVETTVMSVIEAVRFLLSEGMKEVFTNYFCQDPLEGHFGRHRGLARRNDNPTLYSYGYQENKLRVQRDVAIAIKRRQEDPIIRTVSSSPLKKRKH